MIVRCSVVALLLLLGAVGCRQTAPVVDAPQPPDYTRPLGPGERALRLIADPAERPDLGALSGQLADPLFFESLKRSAAWYDKPSTKNYFAPDVSGISHVHARVSAQALLAIVEQAESPAEAAAEIDRQFDVYQTVGWNKRGDVLFTGYYTPQFTASLERADAYQHPLYKRPPDLRSDPLTGDVFGRDTGDGQVVPYYTRAEIESQNLLAGLELVYLDNKLDAYVVEVNGSAKLDLTNGQTMYAGYAGLNGLPYTSIRQELIRDGKIDKNTASLPTIRAYFRDNPGDVSEYIGRNDRFVFFQDYGDPEDWPGGSLGFRVHPERSIATDKSVYPPGAMVLIQAGSEGLAGPVTPINQLVFDQDTGGAIRAPGRIDIYYGIGPPAESQAGRMIVEGTLYYFFLKRDLVQGWHDRLAQSQSQR